MVARAMVASRPIRSFILKFHLSTFNNQRQYELLPRRNSGGVFHLNLNEIQSPWATNLFQSSIFSKLASGQVVRTRWDLGKLLCVLLKQSKNKILVSWNLQEFCCMVHWQKQAKVNYIVEWRECKPQRRNWWKQRTTHYLHLTKCQWKRNWK